ncbi:MAG: UDP-glucose/GDP-mannose dehydrogenase family protein [Pseudomonadota bacterium]
MKIGVVGTGYVGLVSGVCFAELGFDVCCLDTDADKIARLKHGQSPIYEPGLEEVLAQQIAANRITFTTDIQEAVRDADAIFIAVGTPPRPDDGHADMKYVHQAARDIAGALDHYAVIVTKSTVPVGTARDITAIMRDINPQLEFDVCSNPEFLREGAAIDDFRHPDRVVIGVDSQRARDVMTALYSPLTDRKVPLVMTSPETSELIKYAANAFLATKITFINEIANLCEATGANVQDVAHGMGMDSRIGAKFLQAGPGYGGSCFPKDTLALAQTGRKYGAPQQIVEAVVRTNAERQASMADRIIAACGGSVQGKTIGILGLAFKANTDDMREAPSLTILPLLTQAGATLRAYDPIAMDNAKPFLPDTITYCSDAYDTAKDCAALVILTEWDDFKALDFARLKQTMARPCLIDLRNLYHPPVSPDFTYLSIGRPHG